MRSQPTRRASGSAMPGPAWVQYVIEHGNSQGAPTGIRQVPGPRANSRSLKR